MDGHVCERARADKETKYAELLAGDRCRLVVVALETGGRWSSETIQFVESLASCRTGGATHTGEASLPGMEETMGAHDLHILRTSIRQVVVARTQGVCLLCEA